MRSCVHEETTITTSSSSKTVATTTTADGRENTSLAKEERRISISRVNKNLEVAA